ncbi:MAG: efflux RND transporter periplasmic adaptor subunit [Phycisphaerae bacterium]
MNRNRWWAAAAAAVAIPALAAMPLACSKDETARAAQGGARPNPVTTAPVVVKPVPIQIKTFGNVRANATVVVKAQVAGVLNKIHFDKGQNVKKDQLLFSIDARPYQAALKQLEAGRLKDVALLANARKELARQKELLEKKIASQADYDTAEANATALEAAVTADDAGIENARLQVEYCSIRSPLDGRAGDRMVDEGNLIKANDVSLVSIDQIHPVEVSFSILETDLPAVRRQMAAGKLAVEATIPDSGGPPEVGELTFVDNAVDTSTGQIRLEATFPNAEERLWPGLYVRVTMTLAVEKDAVTVPSQAVQNGRDGKYVFVVLPGKSEGGARAGSSGTGGPREELVAQIRPVTVNRLVEGDAIIEQGLRAGEIVVTDGQLRLVNGSKIEIKGVGGTSGDGAKGDKSRPATAAGAASRRAALPAEGPRK